MKIFFQAGSHSLHPRFVAIRDQHLLEYLGFLFVFHDGQREKRKILTKRFFLWEKYKSLFCVCFWFFFPLSELPVFIPSLHLKKKIFIHVKNFCEKNQRYQCYLAGLYSAILQQVLLWIGSIRRDDIIFIWLWKKKTKSVISVKVNFGCNACRRGFYAILSLFSNWDCVRSVWRQICLAWESNKWVSHNSVFWLGFFSSQTVWLPSVLKYIFFFLLRFINFTSLFRESLGSCRNKPHFCGCVFFFSCWYKACKIYSSLAITSLKINFLESFHI